MEEIERIESIAAEIMDCASRCIERLVLVYWNRPTRIAWHLNCASVGVKC